MHSFVNPKIEIRNTEEKGIGSFAKELVYKDEIVVVQGGQIVKNDDLKKPQIKPFASHCFQIEKDYHVCPVEFAEEKLDAIFQINHSCNPNCGIKGQITLVAMRDIEPGEEIAYDYAMTDANYNDMLCENMKCLCGASDCRGVITGEDWKREDLQKKYKGYFSKYILEMVENQS